MVGPSGLTYGMLQSFIASTAVILGFAGAGYGTALVFASPLAGARKVLSALGFVVLCTLVWTMGFRLGSDPELQSTMVRMGLAAVALAAGTALGSFLLVWLYGRLVRRMAGSRSAVLPAGPVRNDSGGAEPGVSGGTGLPESDLSPEESPVSRLAQRLSLFKDPAILVGIMAVGVLCGWLLQGQYVPAGLSTWVLYLLLFLSGISMALDGRESLKSILHHDTLVLPLLTAAGSLLGGLAAALLVGLKPAQGMCAAAGFGWYSLSGILITDLGNPFLGNTAFLSNLFRESLALLGIPLLGRLGLGREAVAVAGATSMDVTLPLIGRFAGPRYLGLSMAHGILLSLAVPVLVPLLYSLAA